MTVATHEILPVQPSFMHLRQDLMDASLGNFFDEGTKFMEDACVSDARA